MLMLFVFLNHVNQDVKEAETIRWHNEALEIVIDGAVISYELRMESRIQRFKDKKRPSNRIR